MGFKKWENRRRGTPREYDMVRVTDKQIFIGKETREKCFKGQDKVTLYWDEERKIVGMVANGEGFKLTIMKDGVSTLRWSTFAGYYKIHFDKPTNRKIVQEGDLWTFKP